VGLHSKGEQAGLMRRMMVAWYYRVPELIRFVNEFEVEKLKESYGYGGRSIRNREVGANDGGGLGDGDDY